jgi:glutamate carboxypeptidase
MNPAIISGGTIHYGIPDECKVVFSGRFSKQSEINRVEQELKELFNTPYIEGTKVEYNIRDSFGGFEETKDNLELAAFVDEVSRQNGYGNVGHIFLGGGSDASGMAKAGIPLLCSCGVRGEWNHTDREYAVVNSMFERSKLWCAVIINI